MGRSHSTPGLIESSGRVPLEHMQLADRPPPTQQPTPTPSINNNNNNSSNPDTATRLHFIVNSLSHRLHSTIVNYQFADGTM